MKHSISKIISIVAAASALAACSTQTEVEWKVIRTNYDNIIAPSMGASYDLEVYSTTTWSLTSSADWVTPSITEYTGIVSVTVSVEENTGSERTAVLTFESFDKEVTKELAVVQNGPGSDGYTSINAVRGLESESGSVTLSGASSKIRGFVVTDAAGGNYDRNSFAIEDSFTDTNSGITIVVNGDYTPFNQGENVSIPLDGNTLKRDDYGRLAIYLKSEPEHSEYTPVMVEPVNVEYSDLKAGDYESMYVTISDFQVTDASINGILSDCPLLEDIVENHLQVVVSGSASFASETYGQGMGDVSGIAGAGADIPIIQPTAYSDIVFSSSRFIPNQGVKSLPYVFSFYCSENTNETSKYVTHTTLTWDSATCLEKGVVCTENDETIGAYLEIVTYNETKSGTISGKGATNLWAENGAHDNLNESGYLSLDNDVTTPPEECGLFMTIPLQVDLPENLNVTFGMGAGSQALKNWTLSYSIDRETWYKGTDFIIDHKISSGSYYLYHTLNIHLEIPITAGNTLYLKFTPNGSQGVDADAVDGQGTSAYIRFHSCVILAGQTEGNTSTPSGAVYFEPFDKLTAGVDYFLGEKAAALANFCSSGIEDWDSEKLNGLTGSYVYERPGYAQIGYMDTERVSSRTTASAYSPYAGELVTPALGSSGDFTLSFKAAAYRSPAIRDGSSTGVLDVKTPDMTSVIVEIVGDGTVEGSTSYTVTDVPTDAFRTFTLSLKDITADTKISFKSAGSGVPARWFIDDILITE